MIHTLEPYFTDEMICLSNDQVDELNDQFELRLKDDVFNGVSLFSKVFWAVTRGPRQPTNTDYVISIGYSSELLKPVLRNWKVLVWQKFNNNLNRWIVNFVSARTSQFLTRDKATVNNILSYEIFESSQPILHLILRFALLVSSLMKIQFLWMVIPLSGWTKLISICRIAQIVECLPYLHLSQWNSRME